MGFRLSPIVPDQILSKQYTLPAEEYVPGRKIYGSYSVVHKVLYVCMVKLSDIDTGTPSTLTRIKEVITVGKKGGMRMSEAKTFFDSSCCGRLTACSGDTKDRFGWNGRIKDHTIPVPCARTKSSMGARQHLESPAINIYSL
jgi:hypothetical protein